MSSHEDFDAKHARREERMARLAPALADLVAWASEVYAELRPQAKHVSEVPMDYPLRHQQVSGIVLASGVAFAPVADYLMISLGERQNMTLYRDGVRYPKPTWKLTRSIPTEPLHYRETKVEENRRPPLGIDNYVSIDVSDFRYPKEYGVNALFDGSVCDYFNDYEGAETYVAEFEADLTTALSFSKK